jgi:hypothetical protein
MFLKGVVGGASSLVTVRANILTLALLVLRRRPRNLSFPLGHLNLLVNLGVYRSRDKLGRMLEADEITATSTLKAIV